MDPRLFHIGLNVKISVESFLKFEFSTFVILNQIMIGANQL